MRFSLQNLMVATIAVCICAGLFAAGRAAGVLFVGVLGLVLFGYGKLVQRHAYARLGIATAMCVAALFAVEYISARNATYMPVWVFDVQLLDGFGVEIREAEVSLWLDDENLLAEGVTDETGHAQIEWRRFAEGRVSPLGIVGDWQPRLVHLGRFQFVATKDGHQTRNSLDELLGETRLSELSFDRPVALAIQLEQTSPD